MQVAVSSAGQGLEALVSPIFGRCAYFVIVDTETLQTQSFANPALSASGGAGVQSAQYIVRQGVEAVVSGNVGPNAMQVMQAAGLPVYSISQGTVAEAMTAFKASELPVLEAPSVSKDFGKGGPTVGAGAGRGGR